LREDGTGVAKTSADNQDRHVHACAHAEAKVAGPAQLAAVARGDHSSHKERSAALAARCRLGREEAATGVADCEAAVDVEGVFA
jgi:hypothetical protein